MRLKIQGLEIQIELSQGPASKEGPAILLVHGAGGDPSIWAAQAEHFDGRLPVYRMALPGHGRSHGAGESDIQAYAHWVRKTMEALPQATPVILVGHSMGGAIALEMATDPPDRMRGTIVVGSGAKLAVLPEIFHMLENDPSSFFHFIDEHAFATSTSRDVRDAVIGLMRGCPTSVILDDFRACDRFDIRGRLEGIRLPTLIICGEEDRMTPHKYSDYLLEHIPESRMRVISRAGHMVMVERPRLVNQAIDKFLKEI